MAPNVRAANRVELRFGFFGQLGRLSTLKFSTNLDGTIVVYGVSRIALPSSALAGCDWGGAVRAGDTQEFVPESNFLPGFVAGPENRLAVPALERLLAGDDLSVAAQLFNPLVLLGPTGTGKSHLAHGITRRWSSLLGESGVGYFTAIDFARQLRAAREEGRLESFREHLAKLQLFLVEDLQRLPLSLYVQRELRETLDVLAETGALVVFTSQQPPAAMAGLEAGLRDRLSCGLTVRLQAPGIEARFELLKQSAASRNVLLNDEQLRQLAQKIEGPAPQLFRAIAEYEFTSNNPEFANPEFTDTVRPPLKIKQIIAVVARYYSLTQAAMCSSARRKSLVYARGVAIYLARSLANLSYAQIGQALGRRDHTTIMHACRTIKKRLTMDASTQQDIEELKRILTAV